MEQAMLAEEDIMLQLEALVCDSLMVVSYKWLSRNYHVSSNAAKRLLQKFAQENEKSSDLQIVYAVSGWPKKEPQTYTIQLVPKSKLEEVKAMLKDPPAFHIYSVQRSLPKDPAQLWSVDFVQAEQLFGEPAQQSNCLRDNRFSAVTCDIVHRVAAKQNSPAPPRPSVFKGVDKTPRPLTMPVLKAPAPGGPSVLPPPKTSEAIPKDLQSGKRSAEPSVIPKPPQIESKDPSASNAGKRKAPVGKGASGGGNALATMWGKAPKVKTKGADPPIAAAATVSVAENPPSAAASAGDAEAGIQAMEAEEDESDVEDMLNDWKSMRRGQPATNGNGRRRRMVLDDGDDDDAEDDESETIIRLGSPESPETRRPAKSAVGKENVVNNEVPSSGKKKSPSPDGKIAEGHEKPLQLEAKGGKAIKVEADPVKPVQDLGRAGSKRKKVVKTRIDEKGREVTEVIWETEGEEKELVLKAKEETPKQPEPSSKQTSTKPPTGKPQAVQKPPTAPSKPAASKASSKSSAKNAGKPAKGQGNIMSFFKKT